ncbi:NAD(P)-binding protein [Violaceomyces palustris]|uniref:NAD(P)-binding protein n=1 Tax=Violaceomyces palustris TaxID=1673888 RepID=A0ACD0P523_9BASI|nr:NAD(P)-binding protein [Violaceomyces palustris]
MKVLVLGASGFIGNGVAQALVRAGHQILGQTRSAERYEREFIRNEIEIVESDPTKDDAWLSSLSTLDVIVDCLGGSAPISTLSKELIQKVEERIRSGTGRHKTSSKLAYVWTSGVWLHGEDRWGFVTDGTQVTRAPSKVDWRPEVEDHLVDSEVVDGIVIRPGLVYGRSASVTGLLFQEAVRGRIEWPTTLGARYATVHIDDLAELYVRVVEAHPLVKGLKLEASNSATESVDLLIHQLSRLVGLGSEKVVYKEPETPFEIALSGTSVVRPTLARSLLGWTTRKPSLVDGLPGYFRAYVAHSQSSASS